MIGDLAVVVGGVFLWLLFMAIMGLMIGDGLFDEFEDDETE